MELAQDIREDLGWLHAGELLIQSLVFESEVIVIESQLVEKRCVKIADMDGVLGDVVAEVIGIAVDQTAFDTATGHPHCEGTWMVVATVVRFGERSLGVNRAAEFTAPDDEGVFEHAPLFKILNEGPAGLVDIFALRLDVRRKVAVLVPSAMEDLHELDASFHHAAGEEAGAGERAGGLGLWAIHFADFFRLAGEVAQFGD